jgi:hypothetical protein
MSQNNGSDDTLREWRESAPYWEKHSDVITAMFGPVTEALIEEAGIGPGQAVLDVAGGAGEPSLTPSGNRSIGKGELLDSLQF